MRCTASKQASKPASITTFDVLQIAPRCVVLAKTLDDGEGTVNVAVAARCFDQGHVVPGLRGD